MARKLKRQGLSWPCSMGWMWRWKEFRISVAVASTSPAATGVDLREDLPADLGTRGSMIGQCRWVLERHLVACARGDEYLRLP